MIYITARLLIEYYISIHNIYIFMRILEYYLYKQRQET